MDFLGGAKREILHMQADRNYKGGNYAAALKQYEGLFNAAVDAGEESSIVFYEERLGDCWERQEHHGNKERLEDHRRAGEYYVKVADRYRKLKNHGKAGEIYEKGAKAYEEVDDFKSAAGFYLESAAMFSEVKDYVNASYAYSRAADYFEKDNRFEESARAYMDSAVCDMRIKDTASASISFKKAAVNYQKVKKWDKAIDSYAGAVEIDTLNRQYLDVADTYEKMADCYWESDNQRDAIYYHTKSAELRAANNDLKSAALSHRKIGTIYENVGDLDNAINHYMKSAETYYRGNSFLQEASSYVNVGRMQERKGEDEEAGRYYLEAAKSNRQANNESSARDCYVKSAQSYLTAAEGTGDKGKAAALTLQAALAYSETGDYDKAADAYNGYAELLYAAGDKAGAKDGFRKAAAEYVRGGRIWEAAEAYVNNEDYGSAAELYDKYAGGKADEKDNLGAANGYMEAGNCYRRLRNESVMKARLDRAVNHFTKFADELKSKAKTEKELTLLGDAYRKIGECNERLNELAMAQQHLVKAEEYYLQINDPERQKVAKGMRLKVEGIKSIDHGYYPKAEEELAEAGRLLKESADSGVWKREYGKILSEHSADAEEYMEKIKLKPEVALDVDRYCYSLVEIPLVLNISLSNNGKYTMKDVTYLQHLPDHIKLTKLPEGIAELPSGGVKSSSIELIPTKTGLHILKPIEVYYEDQKGHKYVKASNEVSLEVVERPPTDYKNYMGALETFQRYAQSQESNRNWFQSGDGYRQMAEVYGRFKNDVTLRGYYTKSVENYLKYVKENRGAAGGDDKTRIKRVADAYWYAGEGYRGLESLEEALGFYGESIPLYRQSRTDALANRSTALKLKVEGIRAIKLGDYATAEAKLKESLNYFNEVIKAGGYDESGLKFLEKNEDETRNMLENMKKKPELSVSYDCPSDVGVGEAFAVKTTVNNPLGFDVLSLRPMVKVVEGVEVVEKPEPLERVTAGGSAQLTFKLKATRPGEYLFSPLDFSYKDSAGKSYMRSGGEIRVHAEKAADEKPVKPVAPAAGVKEASPAAPNVRLEFGAIEAKVGAETEVSGLLTNEGSVDVKGVRFVGNTTGDVEVIEVPGEVESLKAGGKAEVKAKIRVLSEAAVTTHLAEFFYRDLQGKRFFKSSEPSRIRASGVGKAAAFATEQAAVRAAGEIEVKARLEAELGSIKDDAVVLLICKSDSYQAVIINTLRILVKGRGMGGVYVNVSQPHGVITSMMDAEGIPTDDVHFIDCISRMTGKGGGGERTVYVENPSSLEEVSMYLEKTLSNVESRRKFILLDSVDSLLIYNNEKSVKEFAHFLISRTRLEGIGGFIFSVSRREAEDLLKTLAPMCDTEIRL